MSTTPSPFANAGQSLFDRAPSAMATPLINSLMVTSPSPLQSPVHAGGAGVAAVCVALAVAVSNGVGDAVDALVDDAFGVAETVIVAGGVVEGVALAVTVFVGGAVWVGVDGGVAVTLAV